MIQVLRWVNSIVWGLPALGLIIAVGLSLSVRTGFAQIRWLPYSLRMFFAPKAHALPSEASSKKRALYTALAATVGTGNLAGVAGAICIGGPGAIFWMWICGLLGMVTKFAEATLAVLHRRKNPDGTYYGGPMYLIMDTMSKRWHWLAYLFSFFGVVASFGVGNGTQINTVIVSINSSLDMFGIGRGVWLNIGIGVLLGCIILRVLSGGARGIGVVTEKLVPIAAALYVLLCLFALAIRYHKIDDAFCMIFESAFKPRALTGGVIGSFLVSLRVGAARGIFTNEAGMGTASMAHATANVTHPAEQGAMGIVEVFIDTIVICTLTALVILCSDVDVPYGSDPGVVLATAAFVNIYGKWASVFISIALCLFAFATVLGWGLYGMQCVRFIFGNRGIKVFVLLQAMVAMISGVIRTEPLWLFAQIVNGLMAIPNLIVLINQMPEVILSVRDFEKRIAGNRSRNIDDFPCRKTKGILDKTGDIVVQYQK